MLFTVRIQLCPKKGINLTNPIMGMGLGPSKPTRIGRGLDSQGQHHPSLPSKKHRARAGMLRQDLTGRCVGPASCEEDAALTAEDITNVMSWEFQGLLGVSKNRGTPKWMVKIMENPFKMDDLGVNPLFSETSL